MNSPIDQYTTSISIGPAGKPGLGFRVEWNGERRELVFSFVFETRLVLDDLVRTGCIDVKTIPADQQVYTGSFSYPIHDEHALRAFSFANANGIASMLMGIANDLAKRKD